MAWPKFKHRTVGPRKGSGSVSIGTIRPKDGLSLRQRRASSDLATAAYQGAFTIGDFAMRQSLAASTPEQET